MVKEYAALEKAANNLIQEQNERNENLENQNPFHGAEQIQIHCNLDEVKLKDEEIKLQKAEELKEDIQDLHGIFCDLNQMVDEQRESVNKIETNVEITNENVSSGLKDLVKSCK